MCTCNVHRMADDDDELEEVSDFDDVVARAGELGAEIVRGVERNPPDGVGNGPGHRELWVRDLDGYIVVVASPDGEAWQISS